jgi:hypothetical protein
MASERSLQLAAQAWCTKKTRDHVMDPELAEAFADILDRQDTEQLRVQLAGALMAAEGLRRKYQELLDKIPT